MTLGNDQKEKILEEELYRAQVRKIAELPGSPKLKRRYFVVKGQLYDLTRKQEEQRHPHVVAHIGETAWKKVQERHAPKPGSLNVEFELAEKWITDYILAGGVEAPEVRPPAEDIVIEFLKTQLEIIKEKLATE